MSKVIEYLPKMAKSITAGLAAGSGAYAGAVDGGVSPDEWIVIVAAALAGGLAAWLVPNKAPT